MEIHGVRPAILSLFAATFTSSIPGCGENKCTPLIVCDADKALHLLFPERSTALTKVKRILDLFFSLPTGRGQGRPFRPTAPIL